MSDLCSILGYAGAIADWLDSLKPNGLMTMEKCIESMDFCGALKAMKDGHKVTRNTMKTTWYQISDDHLVVSFVINGERVYVPNVPPSADILAEDWHVIGEKC